MMTDVKKLMVVVPCFNEETVLHETLRRLTEVLQGVRHKYEGQIVPSILFVDDGSRDATWQLISYFLQVSQGASAWPIMLYTSTRFGHDWNLLPTTPMQLSVLMPTCRTM